MATPIPSNHCIFTVAEVVAATAGSPGDLTKDLKVTGVTTDTRALDQGMLFVALKGATTDGHDHLMSAAQRGASAAIVARGRASSALPCIEVDDTLDALGALARHHLHRVRNARRLPTLAIGGAAGKTSTKALAASAARTVFGPLLSTPGNLNNRIGVPMTIFTLSDEHQAIVLECGTNLRGEIARLAQIVEPDAAMVLNVDIEHSEGLGTLEEIADEETQLFSTARRFAVVSTEQPLVKSRVPTRLNTITFGIAQDADVQLAGRVVHKDGRSRVSFKLNPILVKSGDSPLLVTDIGLLGSAMAMNCGAALAGVIAINPEPMSGEQLAAIGKSFADAQPVERRLALKRVRGLIVIDDSYNAQPPSMREAITTASEFADDADRRLVLILGDMLELGALASAAHDESIRQALSRRPAVLVAVGPEMTAALERVRAASAVDGIRLVSASDSIEAGKLAAREVKPGDVVLVKGSLGMAMDRIIASLQ